MVKILNINKKHIFGGFWKGMSGTVAIYRPVSMPAPVEVEITPIRTPIPEPMEALRSDWMAIGQDLDAAVRAYGEIVQN